VQHVLAFLACGRPEDHRRSCLLAVIRVDIYSVASEEATCLMFTLTNTSSMQSFLYGVGPAYDRSKFAFGGNMSQTYVWLDRIR
jgi:hypothetical protein